MKILHLMPNTNYNVTSSFIKFINENFKTNQHEFIFFNRDENVPLLIPRYKNVKFTDDKKIISLMNEFDKVIMHSCFMLSTKIIVKMLRYPNLLKKIIWVAWGADLYQWKKWSYQNKSLKLAIKDIIIFLFIKKINHFVGIFPPDIKYFKKQFKSKAKTYYASYVDGLYNPLYKKNLDILKGREKEYNGCINIQIGHSATTILNHFEVLNDLYKFKNENINIYIPISYGDKEYGDEVEKKAKLLFGDKAKCIRDMMNIEDYMKFLSIIDIAIFNTQRQIGLGNILALLYMGKKIFIPSDSVMYEFYKTNKIEICDYNKMKQINFEKFREPIDGTNGKMYIKQNIQNKKKLIDMWKEVFDTPV